MQKVLITFIILGASISSFSIGYFLTRPNQSSTYVLEQQRGALIDRFDGVVEMVTPTPLPKGLLQATSDSAISPTNVLASDSIIYYHLGSGYTSRLDLETRKNEFISKTTLPKLKKVIWSSDRNRVITISQSIRPVFKYFDYTTKGHGTLNPNTTSAVFSPDGNLIAAALNSGGDNLIQISNYDGSNPKALLKTRLRDIELSWSYGNLLSFTASSPETGLKSLYILDLNGNLDQVVSGQEEISSLWSNSGDMLLYSFRNNEGVQVNVYEPKSRKSSALEIETKAALCDWREQGSVIICATQKGGETSIVEYDLVSGQKKILFSNLIFTPEEVFLSSTDNFFVMTSAADQTLWAVKLRD